MINKLRKRLIEKISQDINLPTSGVSESKPISGTPPSFIATNYYPSIIAAFSPRNSIIINELCNTINKALYYTSNGKIHLSWMKSVNFNFDTSNVPSVDLKNLMEFSRQIYYTLLTNNGEIDNKQLTQEEIYNRLLPLKHSLYLNNLSSTNPMGQLASKIGGNIKTLINNYLLQIK